MMELMSYWPTPEHIKECIRTEAEELAEHTLLAVHEPMQLQRKGLDGKIRNCTDEDLLIDFLKVERPIPIIGRSGVGKSHLLRWLHAKLKVHPETAKWHIVRIPKNASLREVLERLLAGLEGETFEHVRQQVKTVGEQLKLPTVARLLLNFMGDQLRGLYEQAQKEIDRYQQSGTRPDEKEQNRLVTIQSHCGDNGLPSLINDTYFQGFLLQERHCVYQFANRLTSGANDKELDVYDYQIHAKDLDFKYNLNNLAIQGRQYVQTAQLNTNESKRQEAADMLNLVLGEATRTAFRQLFQFGGSDFQELFKQIRKDLFGKGKTLVVLVEDMAAISAIEDVLIDSLMEEGLYEGVETMCCLRSAIAVTDGYPGYLRRRDTLRTRATAEWVIDEFQEDETEEMLQERVVDFCSRYINAARYGSEALKKCWKEKRDTEWPPIWENDDIDRQNLDAFGRARTKISLYPLSPTAVRALLHTNCRNYQGQLRFNPRQIINQILLKVLREWRADAELSQFPPTGLSEASALLPVSLRTDLSQFGLPHMERCTTLAAIWGFGASNLRTLKDILSADIAFSFGLDDLGRHLQRGVVLEASGRATGKKEVLIKVKDNKKAPDNIKEAVDSGEDKLKSLITSVDQWCQRRKDLLGQDEARALRNVLAEMYETYARKEWAGVATLPPIRQGPFPKISIPFAMGNTAGSVVEFCSERNFVDQNTSIIFHATAQALLRYSHFNPQNGERRGWSYPEGHEDFLRHQNFAALWVPTALQILRNNDRDKVNDLVDKHVAAARMLALFRDNDNHLERLNKLLNSQQTLRENLSPPVCETVMTERQLQFDQWDNFKNEWLNLLSSNDHGLEGDLAIQAIKKALQKPLPNRITSVVNRSLDELRKESDCAEWLKDCSTIDDFKKALESLDQLIKTLRLTGKYPPHNDSIVTSQTLSSKIKTLTGNANFEQIRKVKQLKENLGVEPKWQILNTLNSDKINPFVDLFIKWQAVFATTFPRLLTENSMWGADRVTEVKISIDDLLSSLRSTLTKVAEESDGNT